MYTCYLNTPLILSSKTEHQPLCQNKNRLYWITLKEDQTLYFILYPHGFIMYHFITIEKKEKKNKKKKLLSQMKQ